MVMWDTDAWGGMTLHEATEFAGMNLINGNLTDAVSFIMHDGDVRPDSVKLALSVVLWFAEINLDEANSTIEQLIRLIDTWERT